VPVVVIQHRGRDSQALLADLLQDRTRLLVSEPDDKEPLLPGHVYVAPADYHLLVDDGYLTLEMDAPVRHSRPSIDVTFTSAAATFGRRAIGVVLTGANADGARGLRSIADNGGTAIVQDPESAEMPVMPRAARLAVPEAKVLPLDRIAPHLRALIAAAEAKTA
jgi:two-component system chemotaxis response regulator CheB